MTLCFKTCWSGASHFSQSSCDGNVSHLEVDFPICDGRHEGASLLIIKHNLVGFFLGIFPIRTYQSELLLHSQVAVFSFLDTGTCNLVSEIKCHIMKFFLYYALQYFHRRQQTLNTARVSCAPQMQNPTAFTKLIRETLQSGFSTFYMHSARQCMWQTSPCVRFLTHLNLKTSFPRADISRAAVGRQLCYHGQKPLTGAALPFVATLPYPSH